MRDLHLNFMAEDKDLAYAKVKAFSHADPLLEIRFILRRIKEYVRLLLLLSTHDTREDERIP